MDNILLDLPGTPGLGVHPTSSCSEAMGNLIIDLVDSAYDMEQVLVPPVCVHLFVLENPVLFTTYSHTLLPFS